VKGNQATILSAVLLFVVAIATYMLMISPKRAEVAELEDEATTLQTQIDEQEQLVAFGKQARKEFPKDYGRLVVLGKAVPDQADTASLLVELNSIANRTDVEFRGITLGQGSSGEGGTTTAAAPAAPAPPATGDSAAPAPEGGEAAPADPAAGGEAAAPAATTAPTAAPAMATEAAAANLPIGAVVGTAGLPTLPYDLNFSGGFFGIADYIGGVDTLVEFQGNKGAVTVDGRLVTVDGFSLDGGAPVANPILDANMAVTTYVTPSTQGLVAGATPSGPAPGGVPATPASSTVAP
jgi:hypothetical protein